MQLVGNLLLRSVASPLGGFLELLDFTVEIPPFRAPLFAGILEFFFELLVQGQEQYDLAITGKQDAKTTLDNIAAFQEKLLKEAGHIQE